MNSFESLSLSSPYNMDIEEMLTSILNTTSISGSSPDIDFNSGYADLLSGLDTGCNQYIDMSDLCSAFELNNLNESACDPFAHQIGLPPYQFHLGPLSQQSPRDLTPSTVCGSESRSPSPYTSPNMRVGDVIKIRSLKRMGEIIALNNNGYKAKTYGENGKKVIRYVCVICGEDLGRSPDLTRHYKKHIERDKIACPDLRHQDGTIWKGCGKRFTRHDAIHRHLRERLRAGHCSMKPPRRGGSQAAYEAAIRDYQSELLSAEWRVTLPPAEKNRLAYMALPRMKKPMF